MEFPQPLWNQRALLYGSTLVVCDLHIGYERELEKKGIYITSKTDMMVKDIKDMLVQHEVGCLIINGDLKHNIPKASWQEYEEIPRAVDEWLKVTDEIHLVTGNHDGGIEDYLPTDVKVHDSRGYKRDGIGYFHGHARPNKGLFDSEVLVVGHCHPTVTLEDNLGKGNKFHCWVRVKFSMDGIKGEVVVMPNFNPLLGGVSINKNGYLGPFFRDITIKEEDVYLLDGTLLGEISSKDVPHRA